MRIAFFTDTFPPEVNGVAHTVDRTALSLVKRGHEVEVFTVSRLSATELTRTYAKGYDVKTIPSIRLPLYLGVRAMLPLGLSLRKIARFKPDILHSHTPFSMGWEAVWAARFLKVPLVGTHHTFFDHYLKHVHLDYAWARRLSWRLTVGYYNRCDVVVSPTRSLADELVANGLKRPHELIANGIDTTQFSSPGGRAILKKKLDLPGKVVIYLGRLSYEKSIDQAIRAFKLVVKDTPDAVFIVAGDGPDRRRLELLAVELELGKEVRFTGFIYGKELVEYLQAADVFFTASKSENMPLSILEAMACGLPIVAVRSLGLSEIVEEGKNGYLIPPDDVLAMAKRVRELLHNDGLRARFSASSCALSGKYAESAVAEQLERLYRLTLNEQMRA